MALSGDTHVAAATGGTQSTIPFPITGPAHTVKRNYESSRDVLRSVSNHSNVDASVVSSYTHGVNDLAQRFSAQKAGSVLTTTAVAPDQITWGYDDRGQVQSATSTVAGTPTPRAADARFYVYDSIGNLTDDGVK